jgi:hypothetical protein
MPTSINKNITRADLLFFSFLRIWWWRRREGITPTSYTPCIPTVVFFPRMGRGVWYHIGRQWGYLFVYPSHFHSSQLWARSPLVNYAQTKKIPRRPAVGKSVLNPHSIAVYAFWHFDMRQFDIVKTTPFFLLCHVSIFRLCHSNYLDPSLLLTLLFLGTFPASIALVLHFVVCFLLPPRFLCAWHQNQNVISWNRIFFLLWDL